MDKLEGVPGLHPHVQEVGGGEHLVGRIDGARGHTQELADGEEDKNFCAYHPAFLENLGGSFATETVQGNYPITPWKFRTYSREALGLF